MNPRPEVQVLNEGPVTAALSGDGGLGMIVAARVTHMAIARARELGVGISMSGRSAAPSYAHDSTIHGSIQGSPPLAFGFPASAGRPCFLLDLASHTPWDEQCFRKMPQVFVKAIGMSHVANILSGTLGGQMLPEFDRGQTQFRGADQSGFHMALDVERFTPLEAFKEDMDQLMEETSNMQPLPGFSASSLPGGRAW